MQKKSGLLSICTLLVFCTQPLSLYATTGSVDSSEVNENESEYFDFTEKVWTKEELEEQRLEEIENKDSIVFENEIDNSRELELQKKREQAKKCLPWQSKRDLPAATENTAKQISKLIDAKDSFDGKNGTKFNIAGIWEKDGWVMIDLYPTWFDDGQESCGSSPFVAFARLEKENWELIEDEEIISGSIRNKLPHDIKKEYDLGGTIASYSDGGNSNGHYKLPYKGGITEVVHRHSNNYDERGNYFDFPNIDYENIYAARSGYIVKIVEHNTIGCPYEYCAQYNNEVVVDHGDGEFSHYLHLDTNSVPDNLRVGSFVKQGDFIAISGNTGLTTGPHLHFHVSNQIDYGGTIFNPYFEEISNYYVADPTRSSKPYTSYTSGNYFIEDQQYVGDYTGDDRTDLLMHNGNKISMFYYRDNPTMLQQKWTANEQITGLGGTWNINSTDKLYVADFNNDGKDDFFIHNGSWLGLVKSDTTSFATVKIYYNNIGGWILGGGDRIYIGDYNNDGKDDIFIRSDGYAAHLRSSGTGLSIKWSAGGSIGGWNLSGNDRHYVGDSNGDNKDDLYVRSNGWIGMIKSDGTNFSTAWVKSSSVGGDYTWYLDERDRHIVADFNDDGKDDLFVQRDKKIGWIRSYSTYLKTKWVKSTSLGNWSIQPGDNRLAGQINSGGKDDLFVHNGEYLGIHRFDGPSFVTTWVNGGCLDGWCTGAGDRHYKMEVTRDEQMDILVRSKGYIGIFKSLGNAYTLHWGQGSPLGNWNLK